MAADRAREGAHPDRLFDESLADLLSGPEGAALMARTEAVFPASPPIPIRTRFFDGALARLLADRGVAQVVLVAARHGRSRLPLGASRGCDGVRGGPPRQMLHHFYEPFPTVEHYQ